MKKLPVYKLSIKMDDEESGVDFIALVDFPAIERNYLAFSNTKQWHSFNKERRIISGALMIADMPIYRNNAPFGEHYVIFDSESIEKIVHKFFRNFNKENVNLMHTSGAVPKGVYMFESFITDKKRGILPPTGYGDITDGSWFGSFKVDNDALWNDFIKTGIFKGFSVEGIFEYLIPENPEQDIIDIIDAIS